MKIIIIMMMMMIIIIMIIIVITIMIIIMIMIIGDIAAVSSATPTHPTSSSSSSGPSYTTASGMGGGMGPNMAEGALNSVSHTHRHAYIHIHIRIHMHIHFIFIYPSITTSIMGSEVNAVLFSTSLHLLPHHTTPHTIFTCYHNVIHVTFMLLFFLIRNCNSEIRTITASNFSLNFSHQEER